MIDCPVIDILDNDSDYIHIAMNIKFKVSWSQFPATGGLNSHFPLFSP